MKTLFERVFGGNDEMYALALKAVDEAMAKLGPTPRYLRRHRL